MIEKQDGRERLILGAGRDLGAAKGLWRIWVPVREDRGECQEQLRAAWVPTITPIEQQS